MSNSREEILHIIRKGLKGVSSKETTVQRNFLSEAEEIQELTKGLQDNLRAQFIDELTNVNTHILEANSADTIKDLLITLIKEKELKSFSIWESEYLKEINLKQNIKSVGLKLISAKNKDRIANSEIGITDVDYAIADTGTLVLLTNKNQPRSISLLPPIHLAIVRKENLVRNIKDLFIILKSKLKDVEDITTCELNLTLGVHGPKELFVVIP
jgi:L-lactate dehydrogenase complex protein LldG